MGRTQRTYDHEYKVRAVRLAKEIGTDKAARELDVPKGTLCGWLKAVREGRLDAGPGMHTPESALRLVQELSELRRQSEALEREKRRLEEENARLFGAPKAQGADGTGPGGISR